MTKTFIALLLTAAALMTACVNTPSAPSFGGATVYVITPEVKNAIALCSAGIESETNLKIEAAIVANGGKVTGGLNDKLSGIFLNRPGFNSADAVIAQAAYMSCLDKHVSATKISSLEACQAKLRCEIDSLQMLCNCRTTFDEIAKESKLSEAATAKAKSENCYSGQYNLSKCWGGVDPTAPRAACTVAVQGAGFELPTAAPDSCIAKKT